MESAVTLSGLIEAGVHFGHRASRWNPRMAPYIYGKRNLIHVIDLRKTLRGLIRAHTFVEKVCERGGTVLLVGTKRQARNVVQEEASKRDLPYVSERWLGGTLTNFSTIMGRLNRLEQLEALEVTGELDTYSKKMVSSLRREKRKILRNLSGIRNMKSLPAAIIVVDPRTEAICVREARKLDIPVIGLVDTDSNPIEVDIVVPGNDDAFRSIRLILATLSDAAARGRDRKLAALAEQKRKEDEKSQKEVDRQEQLRKAREQVLAEKRKDAADVKAKTLALVKAKAESDSKADAAPVVETAEAAETVAPAGVTATDDGGADA